MFESKICRGDPVLVAAADWRGHTAYLVYWSMGMDTEGHPVAECKCRCGCGDTYMVPASQVIAMPAETDRACWSPTWGVA